MAAEILEAIMLVCFGLSWPMNALKSYRARTSGRFKLAILDAYLLGIYCWYCGQILFRESISWVLAVYFINLACLAVNWGVYFRNKKLDAAEAAEKQAAA